MAEAILPTKLRAEDGNTASRYTGLGVSVVITLIILRFPSAALVRNSSQGMGNRVTGAIHQKGERTSFLNTHREIINDHGMSFYFVQIL